MIRPRMKKYYPFPLISKGERKKIIMMTGRAQVFPSMTEGDIVELKFSLMSKGRNALKVNT